MAIEIERKFLITCIPQGCDDRLHIQQAYLQASPERSVRIRITEQQDFPPTAQIAIKGPAAPGHFSRYEFEYAIPIEDARTMLTFCDHPPLTKTRHYYSCHDRIWELDEFEGANAGLLIAEIEIEDEQASFVLPSFVTQEVTGDARYFNLSLAYKPFTTWKRDDIDGHPEMADLLEKGEKE